MASLFHYLPHMAVGAFIVIGAACLWMGAV